MLTELRNRHVARRALLVLVLALPLGTCADSLLPTSFAGEGPTGAKQKPHGRPPKLRQVVDLPEDYVGREFTYTVQISTNALWMARGTTDFLIFVEDEEGTKLPRQGFSPDATINLIRFVLPREEGKRLIEELSAAKKYQARIRFRVDRQKGLFDAWCYFGMISSVEIVNADKSK
jgi:hypothetical protein